MAMVRMISACRGAPRHGVVACGAFAGWRGMAERGLRRGDGGAEEAVRALGEVAEGSKTIARALSESFRAPKGIAPGREESARGSGESA